VQAVLGGGFAGAPGVVQAADPVGTAGRVGSRCQSYRRSDRGGSIDGMLVGAGSSGGGRRAHG
jgi:hypothetical protein